VTWLLECSFADRVPATPAVHLAVGRWSQSIGGPYQTVVSYRAMLAAHVDVRVVGLEGPADENRSDVGVVVIRDGWQMWPRLFAYFWRARKDHVVIFGVWHPVFFVNALVQLVMARKVSGRRTLVPTQSLSEWDWAKHRMVKALLRPLVTVALRRLDMIIFATEGERITSIPTMPASKCVVVYHPIPPVQHHDLPDAPMGARQPRIVFLGRLSPQKDLDLLIEAFAMLPEQWTGDIVGGGDDTYRMSLLRHAERAGCAARLTWHGWLPRDDAHGVVAGAAALVVTSHAENYCHAAVEAMALGVPVVMVSRVAASIDLRLNQTGIVAPADARALASAIERLQEDASGGRQALLARAREFAFARASGCDTEILLHAVRGTSQ
jgi:glycosyltransferase involved in cell wall biosynthesis